MDKRTTTFLIASTVVMLVWISVVQPVFFPVPKRAAPVPQRAAQQQELKQGERQGDGEANDDEAAAKREAIEQAAGKAAEAEKEQAAGPAAPLAPQPAPRTLVMGSVNPGQGFKMEVVLTNRGAAVSDIRLTDFKDESRNGALTLVNGAESPFADSFLLYLHEVLEGRKRRGPRAFGLNGRNWQVIHEARNEVAFETEIAALDGLKVVKRYRLDPGTYELKLTLEWTLPAGAEGREISYGLQAANGLPMEGIWYAVHFRDAVLGSADGAGTKRSGWTAAEIAKRFKDEAEGQAWRETLIRYAGVDSQYFAVALVPHQPENDPWIDFGRTVLVREAQEAERSDVSMELISTPLNLRAGGKSVVHEYSIFAGPKAPELLESVAPDAGLVTLMNYGWQGWIKKLMISLLKFFYGIVGNWGLAILMLTVLVRSALFPLSRKQAIAAQQMQQKMQKLSPEIKSLKEKYKNDAQKFQQAQWELMKKHGVNPLAQMAGCLPMLIQLPIFIGLYWGLRLAIELRQAPLIPGLGWCTDLAAPDQLMKFPGIVADFFQGWSGIFAILNLGPYLNVLPIVTVVIFFVQNKLFMPPPTDENAAQMQKMMNWMMPMMGLFFYKVPSGLCIYFIASSLWGIAERKLKPKVKEEPPPPAPRQRKKKGRPLTSTR